MSYKGETAYITGGASGIARSLADRLVERGMKVVVADWNIEGANKAAKELNEAAGSSENSTAWAVEVDVSNWDSQKKAFEFAVEKLGGRVDYVFPVAGITERDWTPVKAKGSEFVKPNLQVLDVNGTGPLYTTSLAVQHFRDQELNKYGFRGKIVIVSSGCGFYYMPSLPIYTASKHAIVGFVRTYGRLITDENITLNTLCPNIVRTGISSGEFYDKAGKDGLLVETEGLLQAFEALLGDAPGSGDAIEVLPGDGGFRVKERPEYTNEKCQISVEMVQERTYNAFKAKREAEAAAAKK